MPGIEQRLADLSLRKERFRYLMNSLVGSSSKAAKPKTEPATPRKPTATPCTSGRKRKNVSEEDTPAAKKAKSKWTTGEIYEGSEQEIPTPSGMRGHVTMHGNKEAEQYAGDGEFSFFDHALYQQD